jgi:CTP:molybdopterin cytidylyltransferase MocA
VAAAGDADAIMKLVGDQPEVSTEVIDALADNWDQDPAHSSLVRYQDGDGHPMLVGMAALTEIIDRDGDRLLWPLMAGEGGRVSRLVIARMRPIDVNTPEDVRAVSVRLGCSSGNAPTA